MVTIDGFDCEFRVLKIVFDKLDPKQIIFITFKFESDAQRLFFFYYYLFIFCLIFTASENFLFNSRSGWYFSNLELLRSWVHEIAATTEKYCRLINALLFLSNWGPDVEKKTHEQKWFFFFLKYNVFFPLAELYRA